MSHNADDDGARTRVGVLFGQIRGRILEEVIGSRCGLDGLRFWIGNVRGNCKGELDELVMFSFSR